jgi:hypothetical protein
LRIPFPERIPIERVVIFAVLLVAIQSVEGTPLYFSAGCAVFLLIATLAFNAAGGLTRASGAYVFFYSVLVVFIGLCYKALLGEPADSNLRDPRTTIEVYVGGIAAMFAAVVVSRRLSRKAGLIRNVLKDSDMYRSCVGCIVFGLGGVYIISFLGAAKLLSAFNQLNQLVPLAIIIGVMYEIRHSGGTRSVNLPVMLAGSAIFLIYGVLGFSKAGMVTPLFCWALPVCALRYRLSGIQVAGSLLAIFILFHYLVPYSQYGRRFISVSQTPGQRVDVSLKLLEHPEETRRLNAETETEGVVGAHYFNTGQGFWDRLNFIAVDDSLIDITDQGRVFGLTPIGAAFLNAIPHFIYPNKPTLNFGNVYAHEIGGLSEDDTTTGISFSPTSEAYHMARWEGVFLVAPLVWLLFFVVLDSLFGDLRSTPWGLLVLISISHVAPEDALTGAIYLVTYGTAIFVFCAFFAAWVAPIVAVVAVGRDRRKAQRQVTFAPTLAARARR